MLPQLQLGSTLHGVLSWCYSASEGRAGHRETTLHTLAAVLSRAQQMVCLQPQQARQTCFTYAASDCHDFGWLMDWLDALSVTIHATHPLCLHKLPWEKASSRLSGMHTITNQHSLSDCCCTAQAHRKDAP